MSINFLCFGYGRYEIIFNCRSATYLSWQVARINLQALNAHLRRECSGQKNLTCKVLTFLCISISHRREFSCGNTSPTMEHLNVRESLRVETPNESVIRKRSSTESFVGNRNRLPKEVVTTANLPEFKEYLDNSLCHLFYFQVVLWGAESWTWWSL